MQETLIVAGVAVAAIVIGNIIGVILTALPTCVPAGKYGVEQFTMLRSQFGARW